MCGLQTKRNSHGIPSVKTSLTHLLILDSYWFLSLNVACSHQSLCWELVFNMAALRDRPQWGYNRGEPSWINQCLLTRMSSVLQEISYCRTVSFKGEFGFPGFLLFPFSPYTHFPFYFLLWVDTAQGLHQKAGRCWQHVFKLPCLQSHDPK
jgi:hypothetical protein